MRRIHKLSRKPNNKDAATRRAVREHELEEEELARECEEVLGGYCGEAGWWEDVLMDEDDWYELYVE